MWYMRCVLTPTELSRISPVYKAIRSVMRRRAWLHRVINDGNALHGADRALADLDARFLRLVDTCIIEHTLQSELDVPEREWKARYCSLASGRAPSNPRYEVLADQADEARKQEWISRAVFESAWRCGHQGWAMVFNTLTVTDEQIVRGSLAWKAYVRHIDRDIARRCYGSVRAAKGHEYHTYFGVVERGGHGGRLHVHVLHWCKDVPNARDPNRRLVDHGRPAENREIAGWKRYWPHGFSTPIAVRNSGADWYGRKGWLWPVQKRGTMLVPLEAKPYEALGMYMAKYIQVANKEEDRWRVRTSKNLGLAIPQMVVQRLPEVSPAMVMALKSPQVKLLGRRLPASLIVRLWNRSAYGSNVRTPTDVRKLLKSEEPPLSWHVHNWISTRAKGKPSLPSTMFTEAMTTLVGVVSDVHQEVYKGRVRLAGPHSGKRGG